MAKLTKDDWMIATTLLGTAIALQNPEDRTIPDDVRRMGLGLAAFSQRLPDATWNLAAANSEGMLEPVPVAKRIEVGTFYSRGVRIFRKTADGEVEVLTGLSLPNEARALDVAGELNEARDRGAFPERFAGR